MIRARIGSASLFLLVALAAGCGERSATDPVRGEATSAAEALPAFGADELAARRSALARSIPGGVALIPARSAPKAMEQPGWIQRPAFHYLTGMLEG
ncbi:MAG: hypothetical protein HKN17_03140, partial [Rhodothermales bacterium]|nr:hypothetical protein [Rhodothermales bacterium]